MFETSNPKQPFLVLNKIELFPEDTKILIRLYQPLVGATAISLYQTLIENYDSYLILSSAQAIGLLQEQIDCSLREMFTALHKLEAVGLVKTFLTETMVGQVILFRLLKVPSAQEFFSEPLLASLLREKIGTTNFKNLSHHFARQTQMSEKEIKDAQDVSASFFDVFRLSQEEAISPSQEVQEAARENKTEDTPKAAINDQDDTDWKFIEEQFEIYQIPAKEIKIKKPEIRSLMQTYGLTEQEFVNESLVTLHGSYKLDMRAIERAIAENYKAEHIRHNVTKSIAKNKNKPVAEVKDDQDKKLLEMATSMSSAQFLYKLKNKKGGFSTAQENRVLSDLHMDRGLPIDVINIITYVCLEYYDNANVSYKLANNLANDWLQHHIATAQQALNYIKKRNNSSQGSTTRYNHKKHVEKGTDWSKKKAKEPAKDFNPDELKQFFKDFEDKNGMN